MGMSSSVFAEKLAMERTEGQTKCEWKHHKDPKSCTRCDNKGLTAVIDVTFGEYSGKYSFVPNGTAHGTWVCYDERAPTMSDKRRRLCFIYVQSMYGKCWQFKLNYNPKYFFPVSKEPQQDVAPPKRIMDVL